MSFGADVPDLPPQTAAPSRDDAAVEEARRKQLAADRKRQGRAATVLTQKPSGELGGQTSIASQQLLGGNR